MTLFAAQLHDGLRTVRPPAGRPPARLPAQAAAAPAGPVLVAVAHGSRDPRALRTVTALLAAVRASRPGLRVELGHIELSEPALPDTLAALPAGREAVIVPLLFGRGHHVKHDIPQALAAAPHLRASVAAPLAPHPLLAGALHARLLEAGWPPSSVPGERDAVVLAAAGSRDPAPVAAAESTAARLRERLGGGVPVLPAYASAARPSVAEAVSRLRADGHGRIAVASCFTAPGHFASLCAAEAPWIVSAPLGAHPLLAQLVLHRFDEARAAADRTGGNVSVPLVGA